ncbi:cytochrome c oxidase subunit 3 [Reichenbachiella agarivorans]|uniref:Cytochrome c oxidase subunit 3 n=2 Tax=Reichenbachiella agarivorans TaxID=2979464 RepID=A0ABY6CXB3_9BACT|nr:cytochrome c oxidase subunit 3 [Reichenbachiella agarivorans]UXP32880.1 cytochrome c oxidase subunit 3 [Reichenbachiella agarivorans]
MELAVKGNTGSSFRMHPQKFALWLFIVSVVMLFAALTSAYVVKQSSGVWLDFELPFMFDITTGIVILSSVFMHMAYLSGKRNEIKKLRIFLFLTVLTGLGFLTGQLIAWQELVAEGVFFVGNPAGSFVYVLSGVHGFHLVTGVIFLLIVAFSAFKYKVHSKSMVQMEMCATYWHFLGGLWLYLYLFLTLNH